MREDSSCAFSEASSASIAALSRASRIVEYSDAIFGVLKGAAGAARCPLPKVFGQFWYTCTVNCQSSNDAVSRLAVGQTDCWLSRFAATTR